MHEDQEDMAKHLVKASKRDLVESLSKDLALCSKFAPPSATYLCLAPLKFDPWRLVRERLHETWVHSSFCASSTNLFPISQSFLNPEHRFRKLKVHGSIACSLAHATGSTRPL